MKYIASFLAILAAQQVQAFTLPSSSTTNLPRHYSTTSSVSTINSALSASSDNDSWIPNAAETVGKVMATGVLAASLLAASPALAADSKVVGELKGSGLVFKDTLQIERFADPKVKGVSLYISNFQKPITEKLNKGFFSDPTAASLACAKTGKVSIADNINTSTAGEEVFKESKSLLFKSLRVDRIYDQDTNTMVYVSYNTRLAKGDDDNKSRFASSLCAVNLDEPAATTVVATPASSPAPAAN